MNDEDIYAHFYLGNILKIQGNNSEAREKFNKVLELSPDYSWAYFNLAAMDYEEGNINSAIENLNKTLELNPRDNGAYKIYLKILAKNGELEKANELSSRALENCNEDGDLYYITAQISKMSGHNDGYVSNMKNAIQYSNTLSVLPKLVKKELDEFGETKRKTYGGL